VAEVNPVVVCLSRSGQATARRVATALAAPVHGREGRVDAADAFFTNALEHIRALFAARIPIIGVCAAGILIRAVAPLLADKRSEPPVVAVAEDGSVVVPLLGGHHGANNLARRVAGALNSHAAITTAGDVAFGVALDEPPAGWRLANPEDAKPVMAALLGGAGAVIDGDLPWLALQTPSPDPSPRRGEGSADGDAVRLTATTAPVAGDASHLVYHLQQYTLGVGCARNCPPEEMADLVARALAQANIAPGAVAGVFSLDLKADEPAMNALARNLGIPLRLFDAATLEAEAPRLANPSDIVFAEVGCHGVAEGAALAGAGTGAELIVEKLKSANATVALARAPEPIIALPGRPRGRVSLVGIGPGQAEWRTPEASRLIAGADELAGYGLYIDLLGPLAHGKPRRDFPLGGEEDRCRYALERAGEGHDVALICSGDAGIYAMPLCAGTRGRRPRRRPDLFRRRRHLRHGGAGF
jgi:cobalt-precorrin 5A hydrolase/precorrin-3B C17-methyltransferase